MPTHENAHYKGAAAFGGGPLVVWIEMCWHGVGMPQPGHCKGRVRSGSLAALEDPVRHCWHGQQHPERTHAFAALVEVMVQVCSRP